LWREMIVRGASAAGIKKKKKKTTEEEEKSKDAGRKGGNTSPLYEKKGWKVMEEGRRNTHRKKDLCPAGKETKKKKRQ